MSNERLDSILYERIKKAIKDTEDTISRLSDRFDQAKSGSEQECISAEMRALYSVHSVLETLLGDICLVAKKSS